MTLQEKTVAQWVSLDFRTSAIFAKHQIDFCCGGGATLKSVCEKKGLSYEEITNELNTIINSSEKKYPDFISWSAAELIDYILKNHHTYMRERIETISQFLTKVCSVHGPSHPELLEINNLFQESASDLQSHLLKEENILFPFILELENAKNENRQPTPFHCGSISNPIKQMFHEHDSEGDRFKKIAELSNNYTAPEYACNTYKATYVLLKEFEEDLHMHVHLENNILFAKGLELENEIN